MMEDDLGFENNSNLKDRRISLIISSSRETKEIKSSERNTNRYSCLLIVFILNKNLLSQNPKYEYKWFTSE